MCDNIKTTKQQTQYFISYCNTWRSPIPVCMDVSIGAAHISRSGGYGIYKEDSTHARCLTGNSLIEIYLDTNAAITKTSFSSASYNLNSEIDLISYNNEFIFSAQIISYMNIDNIFVVFIEFYIEKCNIFIIVHYYFFDLNIF